METLLLRTKFGFDVMWNSLIANVSRPTRQQVDANPGLFDPGLVKYIRELDAPAIKPIELAHALYEGMRLFYKLPLETDDAALSAYLDSIVALRIPKPKPAPRQPPIAIRHWSEFLVNKAAPSDPTRKPHGFLESYVWNAIHYLAAVPSQSAIDLLVYLSLNLVNLIGCSICQGHLSKNIDARLQFTTNLLAAAISATPYDNTFFATCIFHDNINDINKRVPVNVCRTCPSGCSFQKFQLATQLDAHRLAGYRNYLAKYREIVDTPADVLLASLQN